MHRSRLSLAACDTLHVVAREKKKKSDFILVNFKGKNNYTEAGAKTALKQTKIYSS